MAAKIICGFCIEREHEPYLPAIFQLFLKEFIVQPLHLHPAGLTRPAPTEIPQVWKEARVSGCSGAM